MGMLIIRHKVADYSRWRPAFDRHAGAQKSAGLTNPRVFNSSDDKNEVVILFDTEGTKRAKDFATSPDLRETMAKAGVMDSPTAGTQGDDGDVAAAQRSLGESSHRRAKGR